MGTEVSEADVVAGLERVGLAHQIVVAHASLRSFGRLETGPATLTDAMLSQGCTVLVATMTDIFSIPAPPDDRPRRNGMVYAEDHIDACASSSETYDDSRIETDRWVGALSAHIAGGRDRVRCRFSPHFSAVGPLAAELIAAETRDHVYGPLREAANRNGWVVLMGVSLTSMTLLHLAEIEAGRAPLVRWMRAGDGSPTRVMGGGCSRGFDNLGPTLSAMERRTNVGLSDWRAFPAREVLQLAAETIRREPSVTHCPDPDCVRCNDAVAGGPLPLDSPG